MDIKNDFNILMKLRSENHREFRFQIISRLNKISSAKDYISFCEILNQFKKEFITDTIFFIDNINDILRNLILSDKINFKNLYKELLFIAQIGDNYTIDLLYKVLDKFEKDETKHKELQKSIDQLETRLRRFEEEFDELGLYPMLDIYDKWMD